VLRIENLYRLVKVYNSLPVLRTTPSFAREWKGLLRKPRGELKNFNSDIE